MREVTLVTSNAGKLRSVRRALALFPEIKILHSDIETPEIQSRHLTEIARHKAMAAYKELLKPVIVIDAGFFIESLGGFPGPYTKYALQTIGLAGILQLVKGKNRAGEFRDTLAYFDETLDSPQIFTDTVVGTLAEIPEEKLANLITQERPGHFWSHLFYIFVPKGSQKTLAEMTADEFQQWQEDRHQQQSHYRDFANWLLGR